MNSGAFFFSFLFMGEGDFFVFLYKSFDTIIVLLGAHSLSGISVYGRDRTAANNPCFEELSQVLYHHAHIQAGWLHGHCK